MDTAYIGKPASRVDGRAKVTGAAKYAAEHDAPDLAYGYVVSSEIAKGTIKRIDIDGALAVPGVLKVLTHQNRPQIAWFDRSYRDETAPPGSPLRPLYDEKIVHNGQPVALVLAETFELARYAATLVRIEYAREPHKTELWAQRAEGYEPKPREKPPPDPRGDAPKVYESAATCIDAKYSSPVEHHNPIELFASTVIWEGDGKLTVYDKTQGAPNSKNYVCKVFGLGKDDVRVLSPYVGGGFGLGLRPQYQLFLAVMAARELKRSVKVSLTRNQMFTFGHRPHTWQQVKLGADANGKLAALMHDALGETSTYEDFNENVVSWSAMLYQCDNVRVGYEVAQLDLASPIDMRAPGAALGLFALECAMDELAFKAGIDPLEFRLINYAERDQAEDKPFSSKELRECYRQGAERFGWAKRNKAPRSMRDGEQLIGWGLATGVWQAVQEKASARAEISADGRLTVSSATADIGTGTYTIMTQIAADAFGLPIDDVTFKLGDTLLPEAPVAGGSWTATSVGSAVYQACIALREKLFDRASRKGGKDGAFPLRDCKIGDVRFAGGRIDVTNNPAVSVSIVEAMRYAGADRLEVEATVKPEMRTQQRYTRNSHSAVFAEVKVDEALGVVTVARMVSAVAGGRILNPKTARSQIVGAIVGGIGMALEEESVIDQKFGRFVNHSLAEYHVPVNADIHEIDVIFVDERDEIVSPLGAKGLGEIGIVGVAAAIANAVFHATGKRVRGLPITLDKLL